MALCTNSVAHSVILCTMAKQKDPHIVEHKKAVASFDQKSKVAGHVHLFGHNGNGIAFPMWIYPNALYNTLWGTFARLLYGAVHNLFLM